MPLAVSSCLFVAILTCYELTLILVHYVATYSHLNMLVASQFDLELDQPSFTIVFASSICLKFVYDMFVSTGHALLFELDYTPSRRGYHNEILYESTYKGSIVW